MSVASKQEGGRRQALAVLSDSTVHCMSCRLGGGWVGVCWKKNWGRSTLHLDARVEPQRSEFLK